MSAPTLARRDFLQLLGAAGGLTLVITQAGCRKGDDGAAAAVPDDGTSLAPAAYLRLAPDGGVAVICHRSEMGQGIRTSLALAVAEELEADWARVTVVQADGNEALYGNQNTDGSRSIRHFLKPFREAGAAARTMLEQAAAAQWGVAAEECEGRNHEVMHRPSGRVVGYGELVAKARELPVPAAGLRLKPRDQWRLLGKEVAGVDLRAMTTGTATYGYDAAIDGMRIAVIARPPVWGATLAAADTSEAERVPGVEKVITLDTAPAHAGFRPLGGVAVVARNTWAALQGRQKLKLTWTPGPNGTYSSDTYRAELEAGVRQPGEAARAQGDVDAALGAAATRVEAEYFVPHLAHAPMEPPAALAVVKDGKAEVWAPTQNPQATIDTVAQVLKLDPKSDVTVHVTFLGGGFGRKSKPDFAAEAALLARETGVPVKLLWTREDDIRHDYLHTVAAQRLEAGFGADGKVVAWRHRAAYPPIGGTFDAKNDRPTPFELGQGVTDLPYDIPNVRMEGVPAKGRTRIGWYRSVINIPQAFAIGSFVDELAHAAGKDPKDFLLELLGPDRQVDMAAAGLTGEPWNYGETFADYPNDTGRLRRVVELVAERSGWGTPLPAGRARGIAAHRSFVSFVAAVVQVEVGPGGRLRIPRVDVAIDAGTVANPERVRAQLEGAAIMGIGNALYGEVTFRDGAAVQSNYDGFRVARIDVAPREFGAHIVPSDALPGGVGEPGVPPIAPALCNAIFAATGKRIRALPVAEQLARA